VPQVEEALIAEKLEGLPSLKIESKSQPLENDEGEFLDVLDPTPE
jgi:hypothetical protein